ncbi:MAG: metal-dependent hydrolase [Planctomycetota bacterium]
MVENVPVLRHKHADMTIEGYSRGAVQTAFRVPELKFGFDLGIQPWDFMGTPTFMVSHAHMDHIAALPAYVSRRRMMKMSPPVIFVPDSAVDACEALLRVMQRLDRGPLPCDIIGVRDGDELELSRELVADVVETRHTIPSVGYIVYQRRKKLKPEYLSLSGEQIRELKEKGVEITTETRIPLIGFTGDTSPPGLDNNPEFYKAKILITELTFVAPDHRPSVIHKRGHIHLDDIVRRQDRFENELVILSHFSTRYGDEQIRRMVKKRMPNMIDGRAKLWL